MTTISPKLSHSKKVIKTDIITMLTKYFHSLLVGNHKEVKKSVKVAAKSLAKVISKASANAEQTISAKNTRTKTNSPVRKSVVKPLTSESSNKMVTLKKLVAKSVTSAKTTAVKPVKKAIHPKAVVSKTSRLAIKPASVNKSAKPAVNKTV